MSKPYFDNTFPKFIHVCYIFEITITSNMKKPRVYPAKSQFMIFEVVKDSK